MGISSEVVFDKDYEAVVKVVGSFDAAANASNTIILTANTLYGANSSLPCGIEFNSLEYAVALANGYLTVEFVSANTANQSNVNIVTVGKEISGKLMGRQRDPLGANSAGQLNLKTTGLDANDSFTLMIQIRKSVYLTPTAWANVENQPPNIYG